MIQLCPGELQTNREIEEEMKKRGIKTHKTGNYVDHYYSLGSVIRNTVSQAQDTLCRIWWGAKKREWLDYQDMFMYSPGTYPQSLGELCIELAQTKVRNGVKYGIQFDVGREKRDIQELRTKMYHKHTSPAVERCERLIDLVRTA
jgi:hypothetical protein